MLFPKKRNFGKNAILYDFSVILPTKSGEFFKMECLEVQNDVKLSLGALKPFLKDCRDIASSMLSDNSEIRPADWDRRSIDLAVCVNLLCNEICRQVQSHVVEQLEGDIKILRSVLQSITDSV